MSKSQTRATVLKGTAGVHSIGEKEDVEMVVLENMRGRDRAFNSIVGFGGCSGNVYSTSEGRGRNHAGWRC